jgi:hypothetical protein
MGKIPNSKHQIPNKFQAPNPKHQTNPKNKIQNQKDMATKWS